MVDHSAHDSPGPSHGRRGFVVPTDSVPTPHAHQPPPLARRPVGSIAPRSQMSG